ncbi:unnamed protein product [Hapterophycus canaliculatus]
MVYAYVSLSQRSPAMAYADGGVWVSTFDEMGQRCWVHTITGQKTYKFIGGKPSPFAAARYPYVAHQSPIPNQHNAPWAQSSTSPAPLPAPTYPAPPAPSGAHDGGSGAIVSYIPPPGYETGGPPVTPTGNGLTQRLKRCYLRPSTERSWMWKQ